MKLNFCLISVIACLVGCGGTSSTESVDMRAEAGNAYAEAVKAFDSKDYATAKPLFDNALQGGLYSDFIGPARVRRAVCMAESGDFEGANAELTALEGGAPNVDEIFAARSFMLAKQGKLAESKAAWAQAIRYNPKVKKFGG
jgi:Tfp pilus assembly protein PilF